MSVRITYIRPSHVESLHRALDVIAREGRYFLRDKAPPLADFREFVARQIRADLPQYVALDGNRVVGWIDISAEDDPARRHLGNLGIGVLPEYRRQGVGRRLVRRALQHALQKSRLVRVQLDVYTDNSAAIALYTRLDFQVEGISRKAVRLNRKYKDVVRMAIVV